MAVHFRRNFRIQEVSRELEQQPIRALRQLAGRTRRAVWAVYRLSCDLGEFFICFRWQFDPQPPFAGAQCLELMDAGRTPPKTRPRKKRKKVAVRPGKPRRPQARSAAADVDVFRCAVCEKDIKYLTNFREHQRIHTGERPYQCKRCAKTFTRCADLIKHRLVHSAKRPFRCRTCGKRFKLRADLDKHGKVHSDEAPFPCHLCPKRFKRTSCLVKHLRIHTQEKPFACAHCARRFKWEASVKEHERVHTGERPHRCGECAKAFTHRSTFLQHRRTHQAQPAFGCEQCSKAFNHKSNLLKHMRNAMSPSSAVLSPERLPLTVEVPSLAN
ncbi:finger 79-like [Podarcis lilfordi]|uniref:Finger 79-like n=1 Tax=Podarcis lilfordi TaxID=74358 RepID=A0AA35PV20_9SAUR|nr:finger 79-like [Podarcis lilfordi]